MHLGHKHPFPLPQEGRTERRQRPTQDKDIGVKDRRVYLLLMLKLRGDCITLWFWGLSWGETSGMPHCQTSASQAISNLCLLGLPPSLSQSGLTTHASAVLPSCNLFSFTGVWLLLRVSASVSR